MKKLTKVFISYSHTDREAARAIVDFLEGAGFSVWDQERELLPGSDWTFELKNALDSAEALIVLISPQALKSRSVSREIDYALGAKHLRGRLIPVIVRPTRDVPWILEYCPQVQYQPIGEAFDRIVQLLKQPPYVPQAKRSA